mmetsp:Transcript_32264/g.74501  ORF Transcript_32264/g.74501 Transcript_32264/m.74501 type:complete len:475 (+) Transcript_32264:54-1478(+)
MPALPTILAVCSLAANYGSRSVLPVVSHVICADCCCSASELVGASASAFFAGDLVAQLAAKPLVQRYSGQELLSLGTAAWAVVLPLVPLTVQGPLPLLLFFELLLGFCCGLGYPAAHALLAETVPAAEKGLAVSLIISASAIGAMVSNFLTPQLADVLGWATPFFLFALLGACIASAIKLLPPTRPQQKEQAGQTADWGELLVWSKEPLVIAMYLAMYASGVANAFIYSFVPTLFVEAYGAQVSDLGWLTSAAPLCNSVVCVLSGMLADRLARSWQTHRCRMLMQFLGTGLPAICLIAICNLESRLSVSIVLTLWMATHGFQTSGLTALFHDVAHARASELFSIGNVFSKFAGILAGPMFSRNAALWGWKCILCGLAVHYTLSGIVLISLMHRTKEASKLFLEAKDVDELGKSPSLKAGGREPVRAPEHASEANVQEGPTVSPATTGLPGEILEESKPPQLGRRRAAQTSREAD